MRTRFLIPTMVASLALIASLGSAKPSKKIKVKCDKGDSINEALMNDAEELIIEISGICEEDVVIRRDNVILRGADPASDGVRAVGADVFGAAVLARSVVSVRLENLRLTGGPVTGLRVQDSPWVEAVNCRFEGNGSYGLEARLSTAVVEDPTFTGNGVGGAKVSDAGQLYCDRCTLKDNPGPGQGEAFTADRRSHAGVWDSEVAGLYGILSHQGSQIYVFDTTIDAPGAPGDTGSGAGRHATLDLIRVTLDGSLGAWVHSQINFTDSTQVSNPASDNFINTQSTLKVSGSSIDGTIFLFNFSNGLIIEDSIVNGDLDCSSGGDAFCDDPTTQVTGTSNCGLCPKP